LTPEVECQATLHVDRIYQVEKVASQATFQQDSLMVEKIIKDKIADTATKP
jgi:hypothetical protein